MAKSYTADELIALLRQRYAQAERYAFFEQVAAGTGAGANSWIDAAAISLWPSDGLHRMAFEVKVARGDFLRELQEPGKNAWARDCFHEFWFVAPRDVIVKEELPEGDGWLAPHGNGLSIVRAARRRQAPTLDDGLVASICRSAQKAVASDLSRRTRELVENDHIYKDAKEYRAACETFLRERGQETWSHWDAESVLNALRRASSDDAWRKTKQQIEDVLGHLRSQFLELFPIVLAVAHAGILEVDEAGEALVEAWGATQIDLMAKRAREKDPRAAAKESLAKLAKHFGLAEGNEEH